MNDSSSAFPRVTDSLSRGVLGEQSRLTALVSSGLARFFDSSKKSWADGRFRLFASPSCLCHVLEEGCMRSGAERRREEEEWWWRSSSQLSSTRHNSKSVTGRNDYANFQKPLLIVLTSTDAYPFAASSRYRLN